MSEQRSDKSGRVDAYSWNGAIAAAIAVCEAKADAWDASVKEGSEQNGYETDVLREASRQMENLKLAAAVPESGLLLREDAETIQGIQDLESKVSQLEREAALWEQRCHEEERNANQLAADLSARSTRQLADGTVAMPRYPTEKMYEVGEQMRQSGSDAQGIYLAMRDVVEDAAPVSERGRSVYCVKDGAGFVHFAALSDAEAYSEMGDREMIVLFERKD